MPTTNPSPEQPQDRPCAGPWEQLSSGVIDLALALRQLRFSEPFVEKAVLEFIRANPLDQSRPTPEVYVMTEADHERARLAEQIIDLIEGQKK